MAEFCEACSKEHFGPDFPNDFKGLTTEESWKEGKAAVVICEGCGPIQVDPKGRCISEDCLEAGKKGHGPAVFQEVECKEPDPVFCKAEDWEYQFPGRDGDHLRAPGWYFWDETWGHPSGPFDTEDLCRAALKAYADEHLR